MAGFGSRTGLLLLVAPLWACPAGDDTGAASTTGGAETTETTAPETSVTVTDTPTTDTPTTDTPTTVDPDSSSSAGTDATTTTTGTTTTAGEESTSTGDTPVCEVMIPPAGECPFEAPQGDRFSSGRPSPSHALDLDLVLEADEVAGGGFIIEPDAGEGSDCDLWTQNCGEGDKCMPWANDGGGSWNATRCSPLDPAPVGVGEACSVEGSGVSGIDNCDIGLMCWGVDPETNIGACIELCSCDPTFPVCNTANTTCAVSNGGVLPLCLPVCNPLDPTSCGETEGCYAVGEVFQCAPDVSGDAGAVGDPCQFINTCDSGNFCGFAGNVPGCDADACCTPFCSVGDDSPCLEGQTCVPWFEEGAAPDECLQTIGACVQF